MKALSSNKGYKSNKSKRGSGRRKEIEKTTKEENLYKRLGKKGSCKFEQGESLAILEPIRVTLDVAMTSSN